MWSLLGGAASMVGAVLTRNDNKKEAARVAAANKAEAERVAKANKLEAERVEKLRVKEANQAKQDNTQVREDYYKNVVSDAQAAGINPLTALRTGGGSGYASAVAGTIRQPVMRDGVYLEGVYDTPTLSRNPLASGLETAVNIGLAEFTRKQDYSHQSRMDELTKDLMRAQIKSMNAEVTRSNLPGFGDDSITTNVLPDAKEQKTLEQLMAESPLKIKVKETPDGTNAANEISPMLFPLMLPYSNKTIMVPWNPEDSDLGAMVGGTLQFMGGLGVEAGRSIGNKVDNFRLSRSLGNQPGFTMAPNFSGGFK